MQFRLEDYGHAFSTRPRGVELLATVLGEAVDEDVIEIDFDGVATISYSFADEFIGALAQRRAAGTVSQDIVLLNLRPQHGRVVAKSLASRSVPRSVVRIAELTA